MTRENFIKDFVKIEKIDSEEFGYYPFQMVSVSKDEEMRILALDLGGNVEACYKIFKAELEQDPLKIFLAVDFPAMFDIKKDFVVVFSFVNGRFKINATTYSTLTGKKNKSITTSYALEAIFKQFMSVVSPEKKEKEPRVIGRRSKLKKRTNT